MPDVPDDTPTMPVNTVGIIGAGTMGGGIAMNFLNAGIPVTIVETKQEALDRGLGDDPQELREHRQQGPHQHGRRRKAHGAADRLAGAGRPGRTCDLVIEAVFENMDIKKDVFGKLDHIAKPGAILATNTSALDVDEIAAATSRPERVIGLHFFSPANVMKLLEVVRGDKTSKPVIATSMQLARRIGKVAALVGVCPGFVGNRMLAQRQREAGKLVLEGAMPWDVDRVLYDFGLPMGPFAMSDLAGLDIGWRRETSTGATLREMLCEMDRRGQKTGAGFYDYDEKRQRPAVAGGREDHPRLRRIERHHAARGLRRGDPRALHLPDDQRGREDPRGRQGHPRLRHRRRLGQRLRLAGLSRRADVLRRQRRAR